MWTQRKQSGFTIVELLIVVVVIAILAAITIVSYNGIINRATSSAIDSDISSATQSILLYQVDNSDSYPTSLSALNNGVGIRGSNGNIFGYVADNNATPKTFCLTVLNAKTTPKSVNQSGTRSDGACPGAVGGTDYCPENSVVTLNGYFCDGTAGYRAPQNNAVLKVLATASGVPANAPTPYVGRQENRDNMIDTPFAVIPGEVYCVSAYVATTSSTVTHTVGLMVSGTSGTAWLGAGSMAPMATWQKLNGCITIPAGYSSALVWSQNDGDWNGSALVPWYHAAVMVKKQ